MVFINTTVLFYLVLKDDGLNSMGGSQLILGMKRMRKMEARNESQGEASQPTENPQLVMKL